MVTVAADINPLDLLSAEELQSLQDALAALTGLHVSSIMPGGQPLARPMPLPRLCQLVQAASHAHEPLCRFASPHWRRLVADGPGPAFGSCPIVDLPVVTMPFRILGALCAMVLCCPVLDSLPNDEASSERARTLRLDPDTYRAALAELPRIGPDDLRSLAARLEPVVRGLASLAESRLAEREAQVALQSTYRRLGALAALSAGIPRAPRLAEALGDTLQALLDVLHLDAGAIFLRNEEDQAEVVAYRGLGPAFFALAGATGPGSPNGWQPFQEPGALWAVADTSREPDLPLAQLEAVPIRALCLAPLRSSAGVLGTLGVFSRQPHAFQPDEVALIGATAEQIGMGVQGQRLLAAEVRRAGEMAVLNQVAVAVGQSLDLSEIATAGLAAILRPFDASAGLFYLAEGREGKPRLAAQHGLAEETIAHWASSPPVCWQRGQGPVNQAQWGSDLVSACQEPRLALAEGLHSYLCAPLKGQQHIVGAVCLFSREPRYFTSHEVELFQAVVHEAGLAVENAQLHRETQRRLAEREALQRFNERILHTMQESILIVDAQGHLTYATPRLAELSGYAVPELLARDWRALFDPTSQALLSETLEQGWAGQSARVAVELRRADGNLRQLMVGVAPLQTEHGATNLLLVLSDITTEADLQRRLRQAEKLSAIGELVSGVAHELNNPLMVIRGYAELLRGREESRPVSRELEAVAAHAERASRIVQNLLTFAKERPPANEDVDLNAVLRTVLDLRAQPMVTSGLRIETDLAPDLPTVRGDPYQLQQVFLNILNNAEQALAGHGENGVVHIRTARTDGGAVVSIRDNGPGIPAAVLDRIFDPFYTTRPDAGTGMGLAICYGIVTAHSGRIWTESVEGQGATFHVALPAAAPIVQAVKSEPPAPSPATQPTSRRILVVDDEEEVARLVARYLERVGLRVTTSNEARAALALLEREEYDLIITDLKMPGMNGREFFARLDGIRPGLTERVIFVTGDTVSTDTQDFLSQAGRPHLGKPFALDEMHRLVLASLP